VTGERLHDALALYEWNMSAAAAVLTTTAMVEVLVRNSLDTQLRWASRRGASEWFDVVALDDQGHHDLRAARARAAKRGPELQGRVVAELTFGFWRCRSFSLPDVPVGPGDSGGVPPRADGPPPPPC